MIEIYFDESGSHDGSPVLCVAGYVFEKEKCKTLDLKWRDVLEKHSLPYFRMLSCAHGSKPFDKLSKDERIEAEKECIQIIKDHASLGMSVSVVESDYVEVMKPINPFGAAYTWCCWMCLIGAEKWADRENFDGDIAYFFEAGHRYQRQANALMNEIFEMPEMRTAFRYGSHSFVDKQNVRPIQAADILAWQAFTAEKKLLAGNRTLRKDFGSLLELDTRRYYGSKDTFLEFQEWLNDQPKELVTLFR